LQEIFIMETWLLNLLVFLTVFLTVLAASAALADMRLRERRRLQQELLDRMRQRERSRMKFQDLSQMARGAEGTRQGWRQSLEMALDQSGLTMDVQRLAILSICSAVGGGLVGSVMSLPIVVMAAALAAPAPLLYVLFARQRRLNKMLGQFPDALELMSRVLRSGQTIAQAMKLVADEYAAPLSLEFYRCHEQMNLGLSAEDALHDLTRRIGLLEMKIFAVAVLVQRQTGGNLSELFDKMSAMVRERFRIRGMIDSLTAQGRMQAVILLSLPVAAFAFLMIVQPSYEGILLEYPWLLISAIVLMIVGAIFVHRITHFDF
jgi:tight adherence protein B